MPWTLFWDMHSGGESKEKWEEIYIEGAEEDAKIIFEKRFGHDPLNVTCCCCGEDYAIHEHSTLEQASDFHRGGCVPLDEYISRPDVLVIPSEQVDIS